MATATEVERKYEIPAGFALPDLTTVADVTAVDPPTVMRLDAIYFDSADLRLAQHRVALRRRTGGHDAGWHLKRPAGRDRSETQEPLTRGRTNVPAPLAAEAMAVTDGEPLIPVVRIRNSRREYAVRGADGAVLALVAQDTVTADALLDPPEQRRWRELEVELVTGDRALLDAIEAVLRSVGARPAAAASKLAQALGDRYPAAVPSAESGRSKAQSNVRSDRAASTGGRAARAFADYVTSQLDVIAGNEAAVRAGDPDGVHDMRVACRRLRATLRTYRGLLSAERVESMRGELHWLAGVLGAVRDGDVLIRRLDDEINAVAADAPEAIIGPVTARINERMEADQARARTDLIAALDGPRYAELLRSLGEWISSLRTDVSRKRLLRHTRNALRRADAGLDRAIATAPAPAGTPMPSPVPLSRDVAMHEARKAYKRARYAVELVTPLVGSAGRRLSKRLGALQDVLGTHQDAVVAAHLLRDFGIRAHLDGDNAFSYGLLYARERASAEESLAPLERRRRRAAQPKLRRALQR